MSPYSPEKQSPSPPSSSSPVVPTVAQPTEDNRIVQDGSECIFKGLIESIPEPPPGRVLYITRHGESLYNLDQRIGGNPELSPRGRKYSTLLGIHMNNLRVEDLQVSLTSL